MNTEPEQACRRPPGPHLVPPNTANCTYEIVTVAYRSMDQIYVKVLLVRRQTDVWSVLSARRHVGFSAIDAALPPECEGNPHRM